MKEELIPLTIGVKTNQEIADWFGIKISSFKMAKEKKLKILEEYAEFEILRGKINILKIKDEERIYYIKGKDREIIKENFEKTWNPAGYDTAKRVSAVIYTNNKDKLSIKPSTAYHYTCDTRRELFGSPKTRERGSIGFCRFALCKAIEGEIYPIPLTEKEAELKRDLAKKYLVGLTDTEIKDVDVEIEMMIAEGTLKKEEAWDYRQKFIDGFTAEQYIKFKAELESQIGAPLIFVTYCQRDWPKSGA